MSVTAATISDALDDIEPRLPGICAELNAADSKLGDGDTGLMVLRLVEAFTQVDHNQSSVGEYLLSLARVGAKSTGSSFGTLIVSAIMAVASETRDKHVLSSAEIVHLVEVARGAMMARGKTRLGSKTAIDSLDMIAKAMHRSQPNQSLLSVARDAAEEALQKYKNMECKIGRARMFSTKSIGLDDPGMLAVSLLLGAAGNR